MGERGPARLPAEVARSRGTYRQDRHGDSKTGFAPEAGVPEPPEWWEPGSPVMEEWERVTGQLEPWGLITEVDRAALIVYCEAWGVYRDMLAILEEDGPIVLNSRGGMSAHPCVAMRDSASKSLLDVSKRFGMTPADRSGVKPLTGKKQESPIEAWSALRGGKE